jgi:hypothetical protein
MDRWPVGGQVWPLSHPACSLLPTKQAKHALIQNRVIAADGPAAAAAASLCSGFVAALVSTPADVVKTRLMAQLQPTAGAKAGFRVPAVAAGTSEATASSCSTASQHVLRYRGALDCLRQTVCSWADRIGGQLQLWLI